MNGNAVIRIARAFFSIGFILLCFSPTFADEPNPQAAAVELTTQDVTAFLDGLMPMQIQREDIAGAVVVIVKDGKVLFAKGYGFSDVEKRKPVTVDATLFRPGSISKLFTWTSVMQLVEQGKLDLDKDVNGYIDFKIPDTFSKPITLRHLMTHSPGFEETAKDLFGEDPSSMIPLGPYLKNHIPARIYPPGDSPAYSNYGTALAGYIVERVSGIPLTKYIEDNIFKPLGMLHSSFEQPLPKMLQPMMSSGYNRGSDKAQFFEYVVPFPAGSFSTTGMDISRFMIAHLQDGQLDGVKILKPETAQMMHSRQAGWDEELNGMALGFYEESRNGLRIIGHGGDTLFFHSDLHLIPEKNVGIFVSYNSAGAGEISPRSALEGKLLDRYFPYNLPAIPDAAKKLNDAKKVAGHYITSRRNETDILRLPFLLSQMTVSAQKDGSIQVDAFKDFNGKPKTFREIKPMLFRDIYGQQKILFKQRSDPGSLRMLIDYPFFVFDRVPWYQDMTFLLVMIGFMLGTFLLTLILWPVAALARRHYFRPLELPATERRFRRYTRLICAIDLIFFLGMTFFIVNGLDNIANLSGKSDLLVHLLQVIGVIGVLGTLIALRSAYIYAKNRRLRRWIRIQEALIALACVCFVWIVVQGCLLNFNLNY